MKSILEDTRMTLVLEGRIDSNNAASVEKDVMQAVERAPGKEIVIDVRALEYISSAGLRILMKLRKQVKKALPIVNVSPEIFEIFEVTGFSDLFEVHKRLREVSIDGCQEIGSGANGKVYRLTQDEMIKVYRPEYTISEIEDERKASKNAFLMGVPCAIAFDTVTVGDCYGTIYEMLNAATLAERIRENPARVEELAVSSAKLLRELHATTVPQSQMSPASRMYHRFHRPADR